MVTMSPEQAGDFWEDRYRKFKVEMDAKALMLGMAYDPSDHTFHNALVKTGVGPLTILDADTLEDISDKYTAADDFPIRYEARQAAVRKGEIGWRKSAA